jgi:hypothetical protein
VEGAPAPCEVDCVDGLLIVLSPWAVANLMVEELSVFHHTKGGYGDAASFAAADAAFRAKWGQQQVDQQLRVAADAIA